MNEQLVTLYTGHTIIRSHLRGIGPVKTRYQYGTPGRRTAFIEVFVQGGSVLTTDLFDQDIYFNATPEQQEEWNKLMTQAEADREKFEGAWASWLDGSI